MIVVFRIEVTDAQRRGLRRAQGRTGLATREEIRGWLETAWDTSGIDDFAAEAEEDRLARRSRKAKLLSDGVLDIFADLFAKGGKP